MEVASDNNYVAYITGTINIIHICKVVTLGDILNHIMSYIYVPTGNNGCYEFYVHNH